MVENNIGFKELVLCFNLRNQGLRKSFSIKERKNGDLIIMPKYSDYLREFGAPPENSDEIKHQKFSIHCSPNSKEFNVCMYNLDLSDGTNIRTPQYTKTIKSDNGKLTVLYFCRSPDLASDKYKLNNKDQNNCVCLDKYDSRTNTLYYGIFICSNSGKSFLSFQNGQLNYKKFRFSNFTILVVWTFQCIPSHFTGAMSRAISIDDKKINQEIGDNISRTTEGLTGKQAKEETLKVFNMLKEEFFSTLFSTENILARHYQTFKPIPFRKNAYDFDMNENKS